MKKVCLVFASVVLLAFLLDAWAGNEKAENQAARCRMNVATFNLRMDTPNDGADAWPNRKEMVKSLVRFHDFDIFGTQEGFKHQLEGILELGNYAYIGAGRDDGKDAGEHSAIIYKKDRSFTGHRHAAGGGRKARIIKSAGDFPAGRLLQTGG